MAEGRKIYDKVVIGYDGSILEESFKYYTGPVALCEEGDDHWAKDYPEEVQKLEIIRDSPDQETFYKRLQDQQSYVGQALRVPGEDAGEEDWKKFHDKLKDKVPGLIPAPNYDDEEQVSSLFEALGAPGEDKDYTIPEVEEDENIPFMTPVTEKFKEIAKKHRLTQKQFEGVAKDLYEFNKLTGSDSIQKFKDSREALKKEWGSAHDEKITAIEVLLTKTKFPGVPSEMTAKAGPDSLKWLDSLTKAISGEGQELSGDKGEGRPQTLTPDEARIKISEIRNNKEHPYHKPNDPGYKAAKAKMRELYILADPDNARKPAAGARHSF